MHAKEVLCGSINMDSNTVYPFTISDITDYDASTSIGSWTEL